MGKDSYNVSVRTYFNERLKPTIFRGETTYPLYVQLIYDRKVMYYKSYYFELFSRAKYAFLNTTLLQIDSLENEIIDFIIGKYSESFDLEYIRRHYKIAGFDLLETYEKSFRIWLTGYLKEKALFGMSALLENTGDDVCTILFMDDLKKTLEPAAFEQLETRAVEAGPYLLLAMYVRHILPEGPFCLPAYKWSGLTNQLRIERFAEERFKNLDFGLIVRQVERLLFPTDVSDILRKIKNKSLEKNSKKSRNDGIVGANSLKIRRNRS